MSVGLKLQNYDDIFNRTNNEKFILNHQDAFSTENKEMLDNVIMTNYSEDSLSLIPKCVCGELSGAYYIGDMCSVCNTTVSSTVDDNLSFLLWLERPIGVQKIINPIVLFILLSRYKISKPSVRLIEYLLIPGTEVKKKGIKTDGSLDRLNQLLKENNIPKGYNGFVENFYQVIKLLETYYSKANKKNKEAFYNWLLENKNNIFSNYLPFPNKVIFALDTNELGSFFDKNILGPLNSIRRVTGIDLYDNSIPKKEKKLAKSLIEMAYFYDKYLTYSLFKKPGLIRQHISSTRSHFTARAVITSIVGPHDHDEIHLPWTLSCTLLREHILKGLTNRGMSYKERVNFFISNLRTYNPVIEDIFNDILSFTNGKIEIIFIRNPSLHRGSVQAVNITRFKTDVEDKTISIPLALCPNWNSDFDGDSMNLQLVLTEKARNELVNFRPHHSVLSLNGPNVFSDAIKFPKTMISTLSNWYNSEID